MANEPNAGGGSPPLIAAHGLSVEVRAGWEVRIRQNAQTDVGVARSVLHAATVPLVPRRADYGGGVVEQLGPNDIFIALVEFGAEAVDSALFPPAEVIPEPVGTWFHPFQLQRVIAGQAGAQRFFTLNNRAFCLYVVIGSFLLLEDLASRAAEVVSGIHLD